MPRYPVSAAIRAEVYGRLIEGLNDLEEREADTPGTPLTAKDLALVLWEAEEEARLELKQVYPTSDEEAEAARP